MGRRSLSQGPLGVAAALAKESLRSGHVWTRWDTLTGTAVTTTIIGLSTNAANRLQAFASFVRSTDFASLDYPPCEFALPRESLSSQYPVVGCS